MPNRKTPLYSPSRRKAVASPPEPRAPGTAPQPATAPPDSPPAQAQPTGVRAWRRHLPALAWSSFGALLAAALMLVVLGQQPQRPPLTQKQLDAAIRHSLEKDPLPSPATKAYEGVARSVVRVVGLMDEEDDATERPEKRAMERSLGTGVVIKDDGTILTNLHVVHGAKRVRVTFADGHESDAPMVGADAFRTATGVHAAARSHDPRSH